MLQESFRFKERGEELRPTKSIGITPATLDENAKISSHQFQQKDTATIEEFMADLADRVEQEEKKAGRIYETENARKKKPQPNPKLYRLVNIAFEPKNHAEVTFLICLLAYRTLKIIPLTPSKTYNYSYITNTTALHRKTQHYGFKRLWWGVFRAHNKKKYKDRREFDKRVWNP